MEREAFADNSPGRVLRAGPVEAPYWAFIPNPLPPLVDPDREVTRVLADASYALGELAALGRLLSNPQLLINPFVRREAVLSSRIEGTEATVADIFAFESGQLSPSGIGSHASESDVHEVANYVRALEYGIERQETLPISLRLIRELHERLLRGVRVEQVTPGQFRVSQNWIGPPGCTLSDATYVPPPVAEMAAALDAFEKYLHAAEDENAPLVRLAFAHYQFEAIHPFLDGNGRIGRLLITLLLVSWGLLPLPLLYLSAYFERHRAEYYERLLAVSQKSAWLEWLLFFLRGVAEESRDGAARAKLLQDLQIEWRARLRGPRTSVRLLELVDKLFETPVVTIPQVQKILGISYPGAQAIVERLVAVDIMRPVEQANYGRSFVAEAILNIVTP